jgi:diguanylate cyclase (GGDEF)-like protein
MLGFGKTRKEPPKEAVRDEAPLATDGPTSDVGIELETTLESLSGVLRAFGRNAFSVDELSPETIGKKFEAWAQHLLVLSVSPDRPEGADASREIRRDWAGLRRFVTDHRRREAAYVAESVDGLRDAVWAFVRSMNRVLGTDRAVDIDVGGQIRKLRDATEKRSPEELKKEVIAAAAAIEGILAERRRKQLTQTEELGKRIRLLTEQLAEARREGSLDALTRLNNRKAFDAFIARVVDLSGVFHQPVTLLMVDIDHFKKVNDTFGHPTGDEVLRGVADLLARTFLRKSDFVARYGGEEFVIVLSDTPIPATRVLTERFRTALKTMCFQRGGRVFGVTVSIGVAEIKPGEQIEPWIERADRALYAAKQSGRNKVVEAGADAEAAAAASPAATSRSR